MTPASSVRLTPADSDESPCCEIIESYLHCSRACPEEPPTTTTTTTTTTQHSLSSNCSFPPTVPKMLFRFSVSLALIHPREVMQGCS
ncbi:hypothetical protein E2C01_086858 [Portunus trituberculatus]|uniref:Uncharacterized protein n=1 Tax=Portunus trituberculatus TaxID=210409 RepID=A0A5B7JFS1_PORTR|nr:hypothetical protein [Portunus trituberculatus]